MTEDRGADRRVEGLGFGELLVRYRLRSGLTQEALAVDAGLSARGISDLERGGTAHPRTITVDLLAEALELSEEDRERLQGSVEGRARRPPDPPAARSNLPTRLTSFVGKQSEAADARVRLLGEAVRLLTITGAGGSGKTRLALEVAEGAEGWFSEGVCFVGLASVTGPSGVMPAIAGALANRDGVPFPVDGSLEGYLRPKELLLVLDNFEHVAGAAPSLTGLLAACPRVKALVTSRSALKVSGEHVHAVVPLSLPDEGAAGPDPERLRRSSEAVELFVQRAEAVDARFELDGQNAGKVAKICRRLEGLPLAVELAAARVRLLLPGEMLERLGRPLEFLTGGPRDAPERQSSLRKALEWSHGLLGSREKELFAGLAVFAGGFDLDAAEKVVGTTCGVAPGAAGWEGDVADGVSALVDASLLRAWEAPPGRRRFGMLETVGEYARELLGDGEVALRGRHAAHFLALAEKAAPELPTSDGDAWFERLDAEYANILAALAWAVERRRKEFGLRLAGSLRRWWNVRGRAREGLSWLKTFLEMEGDAPDQLRAEALNEAGCLALSQGLHEEAAGFLRECLELVETTGDDAAIAHILDNLGWVAEQQGDYDGAEDLYERGIQIHAEVGNERLLIYGKSNLGLAKLHRGDLADARRIIEENLEYSRAMGPADLADELNNLGLVALYRGDNAEALRLFQEGVRVARGSSSVALVTQAEAMRGVGCATLAMGSAEEATPFLKQALKEAYRCADAVETVGSLEALGCSASELGHCERAEALWAAASHARAERNVVEHPVERSFYEKWRSPVDNPHTAKFAGTRPVGRAMGLEEAVAYALQS